MYGANFSNMEQSDFRPEDMINKQNAERRIPNDYVNSVMHSADFELNFELNPLSLSPHKIFPSCMQNQNIEGSKRRQMAKSLNLETPVSAKSFSLCHPKNSLVSPLLSPKLDEVVDEILSLSSTSTSSDSLEFPCEHPKLLSVKNFLRDERTRSHKGDGSCSIPIPENFEDLPKCSSAKKTEEIFERNNNVLKTSISEQKISGKEGSGNGKKSTFEAYEDRMVPALRSYRGNEIVRECQLVFEQPRKSFLNERERKQAALPISVFGVEMVEKFYSKNFCDKEEGLKLLQQELKNGAVLDEGNSAPSKGSSPNKVARAAVFLLHRALRDKVFSVYSSAAETVRVFFSEYVPHRVSSSEVARSVEKLLPELLIKSGDVTPRIHNMAAHTLLSMAETEEVRLLNIIPVHLSRPLTSSVHSRLALSKLEMVEQLILNHGISKNKKSGLTCRTLAEFGSSGLHHPAEAVRKVSERILIQVYKVNPRIVRKQLPPDDNVTRRNLLYRQLFQEFDIIDQTTKLEESLTGNQNPDSGIIKNFQNDGRLPILENQRKSKSVVVHNPELVQTQQDSTPSENLAMRRPPDPPHPEKFGSLENAVSVANARSQRHARASLYEKNQFESVASDGGKETITSSKLPPLIDSVRKTNTDIVSAKTDVARNQKKSQLTKRIETMSTPKKEVPRNISLYTESPSSIPVAIYNSRLKTEMGNFQTHTKQSKSNFFGVKKGGKNEASFTNGKEKIINAQHTQNFQKLQLLMEPTNHTAKNDEKKKFSENKEERTKLSESMLKSIKFSVPQTKNDALSALRTCIFCLSSKVWHSERDLNDHYLKECLMLTTCKYCKEVVEISTLNNHLLSDCKWKHLFQKCMSCLEIITKTTSDTHTCKVSDDKSKMLTCPFCNKDIGNEENCWRKHLLGRNVCLNHPRQNQTMSAS